MTERRDKTSIILTVIIILLLVAMGVYGYIYKDKISEYVKKFSSGSKLEERQSFTIKNEQKEPEPDKEKVSVIDTKPKSEPPPIMEPVIEKPAPKKEKAKEVVENDDTLLSNSKELDKILSDKSEAKLEFAKPTKGKSEFTGNIPNKEALPTKSFVKKSKKRFSRARYRKHGNTNLVRRVARLERKLGVRKKNGSLVKRVTRLERIVSKKKK
ncbi:MAG: hypothetical protein SFU98_22500 [Leptospiraceae bacterium]|nr:hypothetical protein [Leptospiraceae bacterium]